MYSSFMQYNEVLVTGGTGRAGPPLCRALLRHGFLPRLLVRLGSEGKIPPDLRAECRVTPGDLSVRESAVMGVQGTSVVVHAAGPWTERPSSGVTLPEAHLRAAENLLYAAAVWRLPRFLFVSATGAAPGAAAPYLDAKGRAETLVRDSDRAWTVFRPQPWYDPRTGASRLSGDELAELAEAVAGAIRRPDASYRIYEPGPTNRFVPVDRPRRPEPGQAA